MYKWLLQIRKYIPTVLYCKNFLYQENYISYKQIDKIHNWIIGIRNYSRPYHCIEGKTNILQIFDIFRYFGNWR